MRDNLLKEAIADAKTVRDTAIANARLTLEEAFKPHLASMLSTRLRNEIEGIEEGDEINEDNDGSSEIGSGLTVDDPAPKNPSAKTHDSSHIENPGQEEEAMGKGDPKKAPIKEAEAMGKGNPHKKPLKEGEFGHDEQDQGDSIDDLDLDAELGIGGSQAGGPDAGLGGAPDAGLGAGAGLGGGAGAGMGAAGAGMDGMANTPDELDLEAIIRELELDVQDDSGLGAAPAGMSSGAPQQFESFDEVDAGTKVDGAFDGSLKTETLAGKPGEGTSKDGKSPTAVDGVNGGKKVSPGQEVTGSKAETMSEEVDLDEILREVEAEESAVAAKTEGIATENVDLKRSLREHREVIQFLRGKLQEVNMLNAKLLYTNKLFKGFSLGEAQKLHIVESFDRATTLREVKLIFTTLAESLNGRIAGTSKKSSKIVAEGLASKPMGSTKPKSPAAKQTILAEGNDMVARMQKLAGIKTN